MAEEVLGPAEDYMTGQHANEQPDGDSNRRAQRRNGKRLSSRLIDVVGTLSRRSQRKILSAFIEKDVSSDSLEIADSEPCRSFLKTLLESTLARLFMVSLILLDFALSCAMTDLTSGGHEVPLWADLLSYLCLSLYMLELFSRIFVWRSGLIRNRNIYWAALDVVVVLAGLADLIVRVASENAGSSALQSVRIVRAFRMMRLARGLTYVKELRRLMQMTGNCFKTLLWSFIFCFLVITVFSMIAVEIVNPMVQELAAKGEWADCKECVVAFSSIFKANITLFSTIVAGDSWGKIAVPVMHAYPASSIIFVGSCLTIVYGVLNLIVAVVVDTFAEQRSRDEREIASQLREDFTKEQKDWTKFFDRMDLDRNGELSFAELLDGAKHLKEFRDRLRILDIDEADLKQLFEMLDADSSGEIDLNEFIGALIRWKYESKSASRFAKFNLESCLQNQREFSQLVELLANNTAAVEEKLERLCEDLELFRQHGTHPLMTLAQAETVKSCQSDQGDQLVVHVGTDFESSQVSGQAERVTTILDSFAARDSMPVAGAIANSLEASEPRTAERSSQNDVLQCADTKADTSRTPEKGCMDLEDTAHIDIAVRV